jgi:hypothetical protein
MDRVFSLRLGVSPGEHTVRCLRATGPPRGDATLSEAAQCTTLHPFKVDM